MHVVEILSPQSFQPCREVAYPKLRVKLLPNLLLGLSVVV